MANPSFSIPDEKLNEFDDVIWEKKQEGELPRDASRSDVIRDLIEEYVEGNGNSSKAAEMTTAD